MNNIGFLTLLIAGNIAVVGCLLWGIRKWSAKQRDAALARHTAAKKLAIVALCLSVVALIWDSVALIGGDKSARQEIIVALLVITTCLGTYVIPTKNGHKKEEAA